MSLIVLNGANSTTYDLTRFIPVPNYNINAVEEYKEWTDSNYDTHRRLVSSKAQGDFTLKFPSLVDYQEFMTFVNANTDPEEGTINVDVFLTYPNITRQGIDVFLTFAPQNDLPLMATGNAAGFSVKLMQQGSGL